jgi:hypothetical protein
MRFTRELEESVLTNLAYRPDSHLVFAPGDYRADGRIMVYRDNLGTTIQHRLYRQLVGPIPRGKYLTRTCTETRCVNPHHYRLTSTTRARPATCPNGHPYTSDNTLPTGRARCRICKENRLARHRKTGRKAGYCKRGHRLTKQNSYLYVDRMGREHRRCKICHLERVRTARTGRRNGENNE